MGKIQKLREQKKFEARAAEEQKTERKKKIIKYVALGLGGAVILFFVFYGLWGGAKKTAAPAVDVAATPSANAQPSSIFGLTPTPSPSSNFILPDKYKQKALATIETDKGNIKLELFPVAAPKTVANFVNLAEQGFYDGLTFHRVVPGFVIQGGDPQGNGSGGPGYKFEDEINPWSLELDEETIKAYETQGYQYDKNLKSHKIEAGVLVMANAGPNTNGSQFFIVTDAAQPHLDGKHTVFGRVVEGMNVVKKIQIGDIIKQVKIGE